MSSSAKAKSGLLANRFQSKKWDSRITTANVGPKEMWLGYVLGPYGMLVVQSIVNSYYNQYMTDVLGFTAERAAWMAGFMVLFPLLSKMFDAVTNIVMSKIIDSTVCRQGKVRPWLIVSIPLVVLAVVLLFWMPFKGPRAQAAWVCFSYVLYYCVAFTMWNMSKELTPALSTRNVAQPKNLGEIEAQKAAVEANRIADLRKKCESKGLNFDEENKKYLDKVAAKEAKAAAKAAKKKK